MSTQSDWVADALSGVTLSPQEIRMKALAAAVEMFGDTHDIDYVVDVAEFLFVPYILSGHRPEREL